MAPRAAKRKPLRLKRERGAYRLFRSRRMARELAAARCVRRSTARCVRAAQVSQCRSCQHWQSVCEWGPPEVGGWDRPGLQRALLQAARQATEKCARRRQVRNDRAMAVLDDMESEAHSIAVLDDS